MVLKGPHAPSTSRQHRWQQREHAHQKPGGGTNQWTALVMEQQGEEEAVQEQRIQGNQYTVLLRPPGLGGQQ